MAVGQPFFMTCVLPFAIYLMFKIFFEFQEYLAYRNGYLNLVKNNWEGKGLKRTKLFYVLH